MTTTSLLKLTFRARTLFLAGLVANALWLTGACDSGFSDCATTYTCPATPESGGTAGMAATAQGGGAVTGGAPGTMGGSTTGGTPGGSAAGGLAGTGGAVVIGTGGVGGGGPCDTNNGGCDVLTSCTNNVGAAPTCGACPTGYVGTGATACTPTLTSLTLSSGNLTPTLSGDVTVYSAQVGLGAQTITLTPTVPTDATVTIAGQAVVSGASWTSPVLNLSANPIAIVVSQPGHPSQNYTLTVNRGMSQEAYVKASNTGAGDDFGGGQAGEADGSTLALSGDGTTLVIGAHYEDSLATGINNANQADNSVSDSGAVYVFTRSGNTWMQQAYIKASNTGANDYFGVAVALSQDGGTLAVGASYEDSIATGINNANQADNSASASGAVYVFSRSGNTWAQQAYVKASNAEAGDTFGMALALSGNGNLLAVGASGESSNATGLDGNQADNSAVGSGAVYLFSRSANSWSQSAYLKASNTQANDAFGSAVTLSADGSTLAVGAHGEDSVAVGMNGNQADNTAADSGAVYIFTRPAGIWSQQAYLKASNTQAGDQFGTVVALSGDGSTLATSAYLEDSAATGINGNQADNSAAASGAVYVFTRSSGAWTQQAYVKASNAGAGDSFGTVAISGDGNTLAVGAAAEDSSAIGLNGNQGDDSVSNSGAVYLFTRSGGTWTQQAYVKSSNGGAVDLFGGAVALAGDGGTLAVAATGEDSVATGINGNQADNSALGSGALYVFR